MIEIVEKALTRFSKRIFLQEKLASYTYSQLADAVLTIRKNLAQLGI